MAAIIQKLHVDLAPLKKQVAAAVESIASIRGIFPEYCAAHGIADNFDAFAAEHGVSFDQISDLAVIKHSDRTTGRATVLEGFEIEPSDLFLKLVAAIAVERDSYAARVMRFVHGWPILSVASPRATVTEAVGESIPGGGGDA